MSLYFIYIKLIIDALECSQTLKNNKGSQTLKNKHLLASLMDTFMFTTVYTSVLLRSVTTERIEFVCMLLLSNSSASYS